MQWNVELFFLSVVVKTAETSNKMVAATTDKEMD